MRERIIVKNFGPIKEVDIEIRDINVFIGTTSSGKSTIAKLISIFQNESVRYRANWNKKTGEEPNNALLEFYRLLAAYNIEFRIGKDTHIRYELGELYCAVGSGFIESTFSPYSILPICTPVYIPAERVFYSTLSQSIFSLINNDVSLPKWLLDFGNKFEIARRDVRNLEVDFLNAKYSFKDGVDMVELENGHTIRLSQASSGVQSIIPLMLVLQSLTEDQQNIQKEIGYDLFVIEEPEMNLYPSSQKDLLEFIIERVKRTSDKLIITTHSPYILTSLDNLVQAGNVGSNPKHENATNKIVPKTLWTDFDQVSGYFFDNGRAISTLDTELRSVGPSKIDNVSDDLAHTFDQLLNLKYDNK
ncbi:AAA family ATPase [Pedobacter jeongneungensis]|uniref:AAA family ATPase n=1 Tax=Pedobacter jeongneungensis TaxID=947309 RepID=UPI00046826B8|nr:AAA family ATPase [Pedobacter jeongneungensis]